MNRPLQTQTKTASKPSFRPVQTGLLQRKCACGGSQGVDGECEDCREKRLGLQRRATNQAAPSTVPPIVHEVLRSPGQPLDSMTRAFMEPRFGHDFSRVQVHTDVKAAESARAVNALAYTVGRNVVFGTGQYNPGRIEGKSLLAHELTHVVQQAVGGVTSGLSAHALAVNSPSDLSEQEANLAADQVVKTLSHDVPDQSIQTLPVSQRGHGGSPILQRYTPQASRAPFQVPVPSTSPAPQQPPPLPARGPNPAACMLPICTRIARLPLPHTEEEKRRDTNSWLNESLTCLRSGATASNASHAAEILANEEQELRDEANSLNHLPIQRPQQQRDYIDALRSSCRIKQREAEIEFRYNVVFENPPGAPGWGVNPDWDTIEQALARLPDEVTWGNAILLRFRRGECDPGDVDPVTGTCRQGGDLTGGHTEFQPGSATIQIFNAGVGKQNYRQSNRLGIPKTIGAIQHEVGHVVIHQIPQAELDRFFNQIMDWRQYSFSRITTAGAIPGAADYLRQERERLCTELGFINAGKCDEARLTQWLNSLQPAGQVTQGQRTYIQDLDKHFIYSIPTARVPQGPEFWYALGSSVREDYLTELYAFAVSNPEFVNSVLPPDQVTWLKEVVFHTPELLAEFKYIAVPEPVQARFLVQSRRLFTRDQLNALLNMLLIEYQQQGARFV